jgi:hypothetical protein
VTPNEKVQCNPRPWRRLVDPNAELEATGKFLRPQAMPWAVSECGRASGLGLFTCDHKDYPCIKHIVGEFWVAEPVAECSANSIIQSSSTDFGSFPEGAVSMKPIIFVETPWPASTHLGKRRLAGIL